MCNRLVAVLILDLMLGACAATGTSPARADAASAALPPCAPKHCVSSLEPDTQFYIAPLTYGTSRDEARARLVQIIESMPRAKVESQTEGRIHATFRSRIFGFVDDVDLLLPADRKQVEVRSSSRIGYYDLGVNRDRVERIRAAFTGAPAS